MIDPLESPQRVVSWYTTDGATVAILGKFQAPEDLMLRQVIITSLRGGASMVSTDPDLTPATASLSTTAFQLTVPQDPNVDPAASRTIFQDLAFPLLKGQFIYWGSNDTLVLFQLIFS